ncbi:MAG: TonB C-terminal domain-containing protein, partial [Candidatus Edwardsbacteria bacterium]|nr:TonB C-terminal domain-containing protein [Candidatus Edwardsbacteria bacterium]
ARAAARPAATTAAKAGAAMPPGMKLLAAEGGEEGSYYLGLIMAKISRYWSNPYQGGQGELRTRVYFRVNRAGEIETAEIEQPSGNAVFDQAGLRAVLVAKNFPPLPPEIAAGSLGVLFEFEYLP